MDMVAKQSAKSVLRIYNCVFEWLEKFKGHNQATIVFKKTDAICKLTLIKKSQVHKTDLYVKFSYESEKKLENKGTLWHTGYAKAFETFKKDLFNQMNHVLLHNYKLQINLMDLFMFLDEQTILKIYDLDKNNLILTLYKKKGMRSHFDLFNYDGKLQKSLFIKVQGRRRKLYVINGQKYVNWNGKRVLLSAVQYNKNI